MKTTLSRIADVLDCKRFTTAQAPNELTLRRVCFALHGLFHCLGERQVLLKDRISLRRELL